LQWPQSTNVQQTGACRQQVLPEVVERDCMNLLAVNNSHQAMARVRPNEIFFRIQEVEIG
jgi:hypothetical protein